MGLMDKVRQRTDRGEAQAPIFVGGSTLNSFKRKPWRTPTNKGPDSGSEEWGYGRHGPHDAPHGFRSLRHLQAGARTPGTSVIGDVLCNFLVSFFYSKVLRMLHVRR